MLHLTLKIWIYECSKIVQLHVKLSIGYSNNMTYVMLAGKKKKRPRTTRSDLMGYLSEKSKSNIKFREMEIEYKNKALEVERKLKEESMALEKKKLDLQEKQIEMQYEMMKSFINMSKK